jgi:hypothetical protein
LPGDVEPAGAIGAEEPELLFAATGFGQTKGGNLFVIGSVAGEDGEFGGNFGDRGGFVDPRDGCYA